MFFSNICFFGVQIDRKTWTLVLLKVSSYSVFLTDTILPVCSILFQQFDYDRLVRILLHIITEMEHETSSNGSNFVLRIAIYLLNSLACQVDNAHKKLLGELGVIKVSLVPTIPFTVTAAGERDPLSAYQT